MNLDARDSELSQTQKIEERMNHVMREIEKEFRFKGNSLEKLIHFKLSKDKEVTLQDSQDFQQALIQEIQTQASLGEIFSQNDEHLSQAKYEILANKIIEVQHLTDQIQHGIQNLKGEVIKDQIENSFVGTKGLITKNWYSPDFLKRIENPSNIPDHILGIGVGSIEMGAIVGKFGYDIAKGIVFAGRDLVEIAQGKAKYDGIEI